MASIAPPAPRPDIHRQVARLVDATRRAALAGDLERALSCSRSLLDRSERALAGDRRARTSSLVAEAQAVLTLLERGAIPRALEALDRARSTSRLLSA